MIRPHLAAAALAIALSACTAHDAQVAPRSGARFASLDAVASGEIGRAPLVRPSTPVAVLPAWIGRPVRLRENEAADRFEQVVDLDLAARSETRGNVVLVSIPRSDAAAERLTDGTASAMGRPTEAGIRAEIAAAFPGFAMQVVTRPARNAYGSYGLAVGRSARGARCLYAWQWIADAPALVGTASEPVSLPVSLRVRLCRDDIGLDAMAAAIDQLRLVPRFTGEPVAAAPAAAAVQRRTRPDRTTEARKSRHAAAAPRAENPPPAPVAMRQPLPVRDLPPKRTGRRYLGEDPGPVAADRTTVRSAPESANVYRALATGGGTAAAAASGLTADLPPEAYRGPSQKP